MTAEEAKEFESDPDFELHCQMRRYVAVRRAGPALLKTNRAFPPLSSIHC